MTTRFESMKMPRASVVYEEPSKEIVATFDTEQEADSFAALKNRWLEAEPDPAEPFQIGAVPVFDGPLVADLMAIIDRIYEPEEKLDLLSVGLSRVA